FVKVKELSQTERNEGAFGHTSLKQVGTRSAKIALKTNINGETVEALVDSGADECFITSQTCNRLGIRLVAAENPIQVTFANGQRKKIDKVAKDLKVQFQDFEDTLTLYVLPSQEESVILGNNWLRRVNPSIDWRDRTLSVEHEGET